MQLRAAQSRVDSGDLAATVTVTAGPKLRVHTSRLRFFQTPQTTFIEQLKKSDLLPVGLHLVQALRTMNLIQDLDPRLRLKISEYRLSSCIPF